MGRLLVLKKCCENFSNTFPIFFFLLSLYFHFNSYNICFTTGPQAPQPYHYGDPEIDNTQMRYLGSSYPPTNRNSLPPRNRSQGPYGEPKPRNPYSPTRKTSYGDRSIPRASLQYRPPSSKYQDRPTSSESFRNPDRASRAPTRRSSSYRTGPSSGAGARSPQRSQRDVRSRPYSSEYWY